MSRDFIFYTMKYSSLIFLFLFLIGCNSSDDNSEVQNDGLVIADSIPQKNVSELHILEEEILANPESPNGYYKRAEYYKYNYKFSQAIDDINRAIKLAPDAASLQYAKAEILYAYGLSTSDISYLDEAKIYLGYTLDMDSSYTDALLLMAEFEIAESDTIAAMKNVNKAMRLNDKLPRPYYVKGKIYESLGNFKLAESSYQTAIEMDANYYEAMIQLGWLYAQRQNDLALTYYNSAIAIRPNSLEAHRNKGLYNHFSGNYVEARQSFFKMLEIDSSFEEAYFNLGNTYIGVYRDDYPEYTRDTIVERAIEYFQKAIDLNPNYIQALYNMGLGYQIKGEKEKAKEVYNQILTIENNYLPAIEGLNSL